MSIATQHMYLNYSFGKERPNRGSGGIANLFWREKIKDVDTGHAADCKG